MSAEPPDLVFAARALAQAHPLSPLANLFVKRAVARERVEQPLAEFGIWAGGALLDGYCLRRVEEEDGGGVEPGLFEDQDIDRGEELDRLERAATAVAADIRSGAVAPGHPGSSENTVAALDLLIGKGVERRLDHWRDAIDDQAWSELEEYLTWWVVQGYALRVAERAARVAAGPDQPGDRA